MVAEAKATAAEILRRKHDLQSARRQLQRAEQQVAKATAAFDKVSGADTVEALHKDLQKAQDELADKGKALEAAKLDRKKSLEKAAQAEKSGSVAAEGTSAAAAGPDPRLQDLLRALEAVADTLGPDVRKAVVDLKPKPAP